LFPYRYLYWLDISKQPIETHLRNPSLGFPLDLHDQDENTVLGKQLCLRVVLLGSGAFLRFFSTIIDMAVATFLVSCLGLCKVRLLRAYMRIDM
jgi:hypothetical protein